MIRQARGYFGIDAKAYGHVGHVDLSALKVCIEYTAGAAGPLSVRCCIVRVSSARLRGRTEAAEGSPPQNTGRPSSRALEALSGVGRRDIDGACYDGRS